MELTSDAIVTIFSIFVSMLGTIFYLDRKIESARRELKDDIKDLDKKNSGELKSIDTKLTSEMRRLDTRLTGEIRAVDEKLTGEIRAVDEKLTGEIRAVEEKLTGEIRAVEEKLTGEIRAVADKHDSSQIEMQTRLGNVEVQLAGLSERVACIDDKVDVIQRRLDKTDEVAA